VRFHIATEFGSPASTARRTAASMRAMASFMAVSSSARPSRAWSRSSSIGTQRRARKFDFSRYGTVCVVGGATGNLSIILAQHHPHLRCFSFDLTVVEPIARRTIEAAGLGDRVTAVSGDFFADPLPRADVVTMGLILHDWNLERKLDLIRSAYDALPQGGA